MNTTLKLLLTTLMLLGCTAGLAIEAPETAKVQPATAEIVPGVNQTQVTRGDRVTLNRNLKLSIEQEKQEVQRLVEGLKGNITAEEEDRLQREISVRKTTGKIERLNIQLEHARTHNFQEMAARLERSLERQKKLKNDPSGLLESRGTPTRRDINGGVQR